MLSDLHAAELGYRHDTATRTREIRLRQQIAQTTAERTPVCVRSVVRVWPRPIRVAVACP